ncbi:MAG: hypothetical protein HRU20_20030 [Pseudomonadales bacterium]|nr:hypothetical protein [Pseudomonadales bacterium]
MNIIKLSLCVLFISALAVNAQSVDTSTYIEAKMHDAIVPACKKLFPHKKMLYSARLQSWKTAHEQSINRGREDMRNLAVMLGQPQSVLTQQKVRSAKQSFEKSSIEQQSQICAEIEAL